MRESTNKVKVRISIQTAPRGTQKVISIHAHPQQDNACENIHNTPSHTLSHAHVRAHTQAHAHSQGEEHA